MSATDSMFFRHTWVSSRFILGMTLLSALFSGALAQSRSGTSPASPPTQSSSPPISIQRPGRTVLPGTHPERSGIKTMSPLVLWDNGEINHTWGKASEENTIVDNARTADDFVLTATSTIHTVVFDIYAVFPVTATGAVDIYAHSGGVGPANAPPLTTRTSTDYIVLPSPIDLGFESGEVGPATDYIVLPFPIDLGFEIRRYTVNFSPPLTLPAGRYWLSGYILGERDGRGFFAFSDGASPSTEQKGHFRSVFFGYPDWEPTSTMPPFSTRFAFKVIGTLADKTNVNSHVNLVTTLTGLPGSACPPDYPAQFNINANLLNTGTIVIGDPEFQAVELQHSGGPAPSHPYRLKTADDYLPCHTGGLVGSTQQVFPSPFNFNPGDMVGDMVPVSFRIDLPGPVQPRRFR